MSCVFCAIASGEAPADIVYRDENSCAFLDLHPLFKGHVLVIPTVHVVTLGDCPPELLAPLFGLASRVARALERGLGAEGSFVAINNKISQSVPHLHAHVVPRKKGDGLRGFFWPRQRYQSDDERASFATTIRGAVESERSR